MAATENLLPYENADDDFIDMEISSYLANFRNSTDSLPPPPPNPREFEFQMSSSFFPEKEVSTTSPADELFYKGKLLPLHLPPRLQMVEKLLENNPNPSSSHYFDHDRYKDTVDQDFFATPLMTNTLNTPIGTTNCTPFESCNISPAESCQVSRELNPSEYLYEESSFSSEITKKSWTKKLKIGSKLRASRSYFLKALFGKSGCSDESSKVADEGVINISKAKEHCPNKNYNNHNKSNTGYDYNNHNNKMKIPFGQIQKEMHETLRSDQKGKKKGSLGEEDRGSHRRSFSMVIKRSSTSTNKKSSASTASFPGSLNDEVKNNNNKLLKRCSSNAHNSNKNASSEIENSIQGAIAHCKQSSQMAFHSRKTMSEVGFHSLSSFSEDQEKENLCRG